jgi:hypothetical protein
LEEDPDFLFRPTGELIRGGDEEAATVDDDGVINLIRAGMVGILKAMTGSSVGARTSRSTVE